MQNIKGFFRKLFSLRNIAPLLIIAGALVGSLGIKPFGITFASEQIILALLAFLAIDALVERIDLLANMEGGIDSIRKMLMLTTKASALLKKRKDFPRMEHLINEARNDLWVSGITLDLMATLVRTFDSKMKEGCNIRFMALDPEGDSLQMAARFQGQHPNLDPFRIGSNLTMIASGLKSTGRGTVEIKVLDRVFTTGYFIVDPLGPRGRMIVQLYLYHIDPEDSPLFELSKEEDPQWFSTYLNQFEMAWSDAKSFQLQRDRKSEKRPLT